MIPTVMDRHGLRFIVAALSIASLPAEINACQVEGMALRPIKVAQFAASTPHHTGFSTFVDLTVDRFGDLYVLLRDPVELAVFDSTGRYKRSFSQRMRDASGAPTRVGIRNDSIWLLDPSQHAITWLSRDGGHLGSTTVRVTWRDSVGASNVLAAPLADGLYYGAPALHSAIIASGLATRVPFLRFDSRGNVVDTLAWLNVAPYHTAAVELGPRGERGYLPQPFKDYSLLGVSPAGDRIIIADRHIRRGHNEPSVVVRQIGMLGDTVAETAVAVAPIRLNEAYIDAIVTEIFQRPAPFGGHIDAKRYREVIWKPPYVPPIEQLIVGVDGSVWLLLSRRTIIGGAERDWIVLSDRFRQRYHIRLPDNLTLEHVSLGRVWGLLLDKAGKRTIVRFRIQNES